MEVPLSDVLDRLSILKLKLERIGEEVREEYETYERALKEFKKRGTNIREDWLERLYEINSGIWDLEFDIRRGKEGELGLEEVGRRAILIRELNKKRVGIKNQIAEETGLGFKDVKMNHASE